MRVRRWAPAMATTAAPTTMATYRERGSAVLIAIIIMVAVSVVRRISLCRMVCV
jgi:hypothetical protein